MGFFDFLKEKEEKKTEKISFDSLGKWISNKKEEAKGKEKALLDALRENISFLVGELESQIVVLEGISLEEKKVEEKLKLISKENLNNYIVHLKNLIEDLKNIDSDGILKLIYEKEKVFSEFESKSAISFHKATILVGREMEVVKEGIGEFLKEFRELIKENKDFVDSSTALFKIESKFEQIKEEEIKKEVIDNDIKSINEEIENFENKVKENSKKIEEFRKGERYLGYQEKIRRLGQSKKEVEEKIQELKKRIDFKKLAGNYHRKQNGDN